MKTQRRHELQTNELADYLGKGIERIRPYSQTIVVGVLGVLAVLVAITLFTNWLSSSKAASWTDYLTAANAATPNAEDLQEVADANPDTPAAPWALLSAGEIWMGQGAQRLFQDPEEAEKTLKKARDALEELENNPSKIPAITQRGQFVLGKVFESLAAIRDTTTNLDKAKKHYQNVIDGDPDSALADVAESALARLNDPFTYETLKSFASYKPKLPDPPGLTPPGSDSLGLNLDELKLDGGGTSLSNDLPGNLVPPTNQVAPPPTKSQPPEKTAPPPKTETEKKPGGEKKPDGEKTK